MCERVRLSHTKSSLTKDGIPVTIQTASLFLLFVPSVIAALLLLVHLARAVRAPARVDWEAADEEMRTLAERQSTHRGSPATLHATD